MQELWISSLEFDRSFRDFEIACPQSIALCKVCLSASAVSVSEGFLRTVSLMFFCALGGHIPVSFLKDRMWSINPMIF